MNQQNGSMYEIAENPMVANRRTAGGQRNAALAGMDMSDGLPGLPYILSGINPVIGANGTGQIQIQYNQSFAMFRVFAGLLKYETGLERCNVLSLTTSDYGGRTIIDGTTQFCMVGQRNDEAVRRPEWPLHIVVGKGNQVIITLQDTTGGGIAAGFVCFTMYGKLLQDNSGGMSQ